MSGGTLPASTSTLDQHAPYEWSYQPTTAKLLAATGGLVCRQLNGKVAEHANAYRTKTRKFALLLPDSADSGGGVSGQQSLLTVLAGCGVSKPPIVYYAQGTGTGALSASFTQLRSEGVTTVLFLPSGATGPGSPQGIASTVGYDPEWVLMGASPRNSADSLVASGAEAKNSFGVAAWSKIPAPASEPWNEAYLAGGGTTNDLVYGAKGFYVELQLLASGIQMAGPSLTPTSFAAALASTTFPNPEAGAAPSYQAHVGFASGHEMVEDFAGFWLDPTASASQEVTDNYEQNYQDYQAFCYVALGSRSTASSWPSADRYYQGSCR